MNKQLTPETMKAEQIKQITDMALVDIDIVCFDKEQRRAFTQGARQMSFALHMALIENDTISREDIKLVYSKLDEEVTKSLS